MLTGEKRQVFLENLIYLILWLILFLTPAIDNYYTNAAFDWQEVFRVWKVLLPFLGLFLLHNYALIPLLLFRKRYWLYLLLVLVTAGLTYVVHTQDKPGKPDGFAPPTPREMPPPEHQQKREYTGIMPPPGMEHRQREVKPPEMRHLMRPYLNFLLIACLIIGVNLAIKLLFKSLRDGQRMKELERHNLQTELDYLKHQINPHFFMNTLNNIHALIDIDTEKAKNTILELSKMMRYLLYESSKPTLPLKDEIHFITNYIELMRIRYTDQVEIVVSVPEELPQVQVPPLLSISFIENAFKHGISYQHSSFVHVCMEIKEKELHCRINNSSFNHSNEQQKGIGLENIRKRLQLLYGENYTLEIREEDHQYHVLLIIPLPL